MTLVEIFLFDIRLIKSDRHIIWQCQLLVLGDFLRQSAEINTSVEYHTESTMTHENRLSLHFIYIIINLYTISVVQSNSLLLPQAGYPSHLNFQTKFWLPLLAASKQEVGNISLSKWEGHTSPKAS